MQPKRWALLFLALALSGCVLCKRADEPPVASAPPASASAPLSPAHPLWSSSTFAVIAGVLSFQSPSLAPFSPRNRKDVELYQKLVHRGVPAANMSLLIDEAVTASALRDAIARQASAARPGSTFVFYYAGHGMRDDAGNPFFAAYDTAGDPASTAFSLGDLTRILKSSFRGSRVVLMADCCYSGALKDVAQELSASGLLTASITSADASNVSTSNWTFTQTILDALAGDPLLDIDRNGTITIGELGSEVADAMKHREKQRHGFSLNGVSPQLPWGSAQRAPAPSSSHFKVGAYVEANLDGKWQPARVVLSDTRQPTLRFYNYSDSSDRRVEVARIRDMRFERHPVGAAIRVYWGGKIWDAKVIEADGDFHKITYPGWPAYWDEWVLSDRIVGPTANVEPVEIATGEHVDVEWQGQWYPAVVLERSGNRALIHYEGYASSWDEWVGPARIRPRK